MSATIVARGLSGGHAHRTLFSSLSLTVAAGDVIGVVGANGAGKSTVLRLLAGYDTPLSGSVTAAPSDAFIGWLPQEHERIPGETVADYICRRTGAAAATIAMEATAEALGLGTPGADDAYAIALDHWLACGATDLDERIPPMLADLGLNVGADTLMTTLSGGQAARAALAALLLSRFDLVLLDEPSNDLDLAGLERLESFVRGLRSGVVLVSHDREFLARCVTRIVELDLAQNKVTVYDGGYDSFLKERAVARRHTRDAYDDFAGKKADLVSATPSLCDGLLPAALTRFHQAHPDIDLEVQEAGSRLLTRELAYGRLDVALLIVPLHNSDPDIETTPVLRERLVLASPVDADMPERMDVSGLRDLPLVMFREGYDLRDVTLRACEAAGFEPRLAVEGGEMGAVLRFVEAGLGHAVVPSMVLETRPRIRATQLENPPLDRALAHRSSEALPLAARAFKSELLEHLTTVTTEATAV